MKNIYGISRPGQMQYQYSTIVLVLVLQKFAVQCTATDQLQYCSTFTCTGTAKIVQYTTGIVLVLVLVLVLL